MKRICLVLGIAAVLLLTAMPALADAPIATPGPASNVWDDTAVLNGGVDPGGETLTKCQFTYSPDPTMVLGAETTNCEVFPSGDSSTGVYAILKGLLPNTTYYFTLTAANASGSSTSAMNSFTTSDTPPPAPAATTQPATAVASTSATLNATVDAENVAVVSCVFEYGTSTGYGQSVPCSPVTTTSQSQGVSADISSLAPQQTYHFQVVFKTEGGTTDGGDQQLTATDQGSSTTPTQTTTTPPPAPPRGSTQPATRITTISAVLHGMVNLEGGTLMGCDFQYGRSSKVNGHVTISHPRAIPCAPQPAGDGSVEVAARITRLAVSKWYGFELLVTTSGGTATGSVWSFKTKLPKPGVRITRTKISRKLGKATFRFRWTAVKATKYECALVRVRRGKAARPHYKRCRSPRAYRRLGKRQYEFVVRAGNAAGYGRARTRRFRI